MEILDKDLNSLPIENGVEGEVVYTGLVKECQPLIRWRDKDLVRVYTDPCVCGLPGPRIEFLGRVDDMLLVKGVNVFPNAVRDVIARTSELVSGEIQIIRTSPSSVVEAPVQVDVCLQPCVGLECRNELKVLLEQALQSTLRFRASVRLIEPDDFVPEYGPTGKAKLVRTLS
jgi:phenylacetate-CoA ligase